MSSQQTCLRSGRGGEVLALPTCNSMGREEKHLIKDSETPKKTKPNFTRSPASRNRQAKAFWLLTPGSKEFGRARGPRD